MSTLIHADVFFFISTIGFILIIICVLIAMIFVLIILRNLAQISKRAKEESFEIINDIKDLRTEAKKEASFVTTFVKFLFKIFGKNKSD